MRRLAVAIAVTITSLVGGIAAFAPAAHADSCVSVHLNVNGQDVVNQTQCLPGA